MPAAIGWGASPVIVALPATAVNCTSKGKRSGYTVRTSIGFARAIMGHAAKGPLARPEDFR